MIITAMMPVMFIPCICPGMITSQAEIDELNATARAKGHEYYHQRLTGVGDLKFVDLNGDGTIDDNDRTFC